MSRPVIRVSEWALGELRRRSADEGRTMVAVLDRLLGKRPDGVVETALGVPIKTTISMTCPKCGCMVGVHRAGESRERCERHPACVWHREP